MSRSERRADILMCDVVPVTHWATAPNNAVVSRRSRRPRKCGMNVSTIQ